MQTEWLTCTSLHLQSQKAPRQFMAKKTFPKSRIFCTPVVPKLSVSGGLGD
uniref:Uncharacterized protein n=1 Tax=Anguilla anguilla TaxID=7936 RepID=A0A0E9QCE8_ANGAN